MALAWWGWCLITLSCVIVAHVVAAMLLCVFPVWQRSTKADSLASTAMVTAGGAKDAQPLALATVMSATPTSARGATKKSDATFFTTYFHLEGVDDDFTADQELVPMFASDHMKTQ